MIQLLPMFDLVAIFDNTFLFLTLVVLTFGAISFVSRSFIVSAFSAYLGFVSITMTTDYTFFKNLLMVIITLTTLLLAFQIWGFISDGGGESQI